MNTETSIISKARSAGAIAAARQLVRLKIDQSQPIDIFDVIEKAGIWLFFQPLQGLQGAYLKNPLNESRAIIINSRRPLSKQRLTAGHEYGHYILGHEASLDEAADVEQSDSKVVQEAAAQTFANDFLMPPQLVNTYWKSLGLPVQQREIEPHQVYLLSLYLGVSYQALIYQLVALKRINWQTARRMTDYQPRQIKQLLARGIGPLDSRADVWPLVKEDQGRHLKTRINDEVSIALPETPSSGYRWTIIAPPILDFSQELAKGLSKLNATTRLTQLVTPDTCLALLSDDFEGRSRADEHTGSGGNRYLNFRITKSGSFALSLALIRSWQPLGPPASTFEVTIEAARQTTGDIENGPREEVKQSLANNLAT